MIKFVIPQFPKAQTELKPKYSQLRIDFTEGNMTGLEPNINKIKDTITVKNILDYNSHPVILKQSSNFSKTKTVDMEKYI